MRGKANTKADDFLGYFFGIQRSHGKNQVAITEKWRVSTE